MSLHASIDLAHAFGQAGCFLTCVPLMEFYDVAALLLNFARKLSDGVQFELHLSLDFLTAKRFFVGHLESDLFVSPKIFPLRLATSFRDVFEALFVFFPVFIFILQFLYLFLLVKYLVKLPAHHFFF